MRFAMMMTIGVLAGSAHTQPSMAGPDEPGPVLAPQKINNTAAASADLSDQLFKLLANDGAANDNFGYSVAISGTTAVVGAWRDDDNGTDSGSTYLFDTTTGRQIAKLLPKDGAASNNFGRSVAIDGAIAIVGANFDDDNGTNSGSAYLFDAEITAGGGQIAKILPNDGAAYEWFGWSVAIDGATAIVGAAQDDDNGTASGSAYLFDISDPASPIQIAKLLPDDGAAHEWFGWSVAISGTTAIVGARNDDENGSDSGAAYLFDTTTGRQIAKLLADDGAGGDEFGWSVAISGDTAIVGAHDDGDNGSASGSAYLFDTTTGRQIAKLLPDNGSANDHFGASVAISGTTAVVGAWRNLGNGSISGSAYLFDISDRANPAQIAKLLPNDGSVVDRFGWSVAIRGATAVVGAVWHDDNGDDSGAAYLFDAAAPGKCPWDLDDNAAVGASDLLALLVSWGPCKGCQFQECPADFDGNCTVGATDLIAMLVNWGPCP